MAEGSALQLAVGDRVVYPNQGVCRITAIDVKEVAGQKLTFVTMRKEEDGAVVHVPQSKVVAIGLRKVAGRAEVDAIYEFLRADTDKADLDWKQRARTNLDRMTTGGLLGLAEVVKGLQVLSELRPLPTKERELYDNARHLLVLEVAAALSIPEVDAEDSVDLVLFPPGRERPKRTAEEFKRPVSEGGDEELGLEDELLGLEGDLELPPDEEAPEAEPAEEEAPAEEPTEEAEAEAAPRGRKKAAAAGGEAEAGAGGEAPKRKRGRPPKPKVESAEAAAPKKRGRPPKAKVESAEAAAPKKRGRPPKAKDEAAGPPAAKSKKR
jgi:CarD family transcriptional regulator